MNRKNSILLYIAATAAVSFALLISLSLNIWLGGEGILLGFFAAVMGSAWFGGFGPGLWAAFLSALARLYFFVPVSPLSSADPRGWVPTALFTIEAVLLGFLSAISSASRERAEANALEARLEISERSRAEERIHFQARLLDAVERAVIATDLKGTIVSWNRFAEKLYGWSAQEALGRSILEMMPAPGAEEEGAEIMKRLTKGESWSGEFLVRRRDGHSFPMMITNSPIYDDEKNLIGIVGVSFHTTEWKKRERRLAAQHAVTAVLSEAKTLGEAAPKILLALCEGLEWELGALWRIDRRADQLRCFEILSCSSELSFPEFAAASRGKTFSLGEELPGKVWREGKSVWIPDFAVEGSGLRAEIATKEGLHGACGFPIALGAEIYGTLEFFSRKTRPPDNDIQEMMTSIGRQIGQFIERRRAEEAEREAHAALEIKVRELQKRLAVSEALHRFSSRFPLGEEIGPFLKEIVKEAATLTETAFCSIGLIDAERETIKPEATYGFKEELLAGIEFPISQDRSDIIYRILYRGETVNLEQILTTPGIEKYREIIEKLQLRTALITPMQVRGAPIGVLGIYNKIDGDAFTAQDIQLIQTIANQVAGSISNARLYKNLEKKNEELWKRTVEAQELSRLKTEFLSNISHELRTPLNAILGYTHLLREDTYGALSAAQEAPMEGILRNGQDLLRLVNDVLDFSRIEAGKLSLHLGRVEAPILFEETLTKMKPLIDQKSLSAEWSAPRNLPEIESDPQKLLQILSNLISNAIKFTPRGKITLEAADLPGRDGIEIKVKDTGVGIKPEELSKIFDPFHQGDGSSTREYGGVGLGLTIVKELVQTLKGEIQVESEYGRGATFTLFLPYRIEDRDPLAKSA